MSSSSVQLFSCVRNLDGVIGGNRNMSAVQNGGT